MTAVTITTALRLTIVKHLASGKSLDVVATIVGLPRERVLDVASDHGYPDTTRLNKAAGILAKRVADEAPAAAPPPRPEPPARPERRWEEPVPNRRPAQPAAEGPPTNHSVITTGLQHPSKRIQNAARKIAADLDRLRGLIREHDEKEAARQKETQEKARARAEVERLEAQLREAKAKLRGGSSTTPHGQFPCPVCARVFTTPQGRAAHRNQPQSSCPRFPDPEES